MSESIWDDPRITNYVLGEMSDEERRDFEHELASSSELVAAVDEARIVADQLSSLYGDEPVPLLEPQRRESIIATPASDTPQISTHSWPRVGLVLAIAAALLLLIGVAPMAYKKQRAEARRELAKERSTPSLALSPSPAESNVESLSRVASNAPADSDGISPTPQNLEFGRVELEIDSSQEELPVATRSIRPNVGRSSVDQQPTELSAELESELARPTSYPAPQEGLSTGLASKGLARKTAAPQSGLGDVASLSVEFVDDDSGVLLRGRKESKAKAEEVIERLNQSEPKSRSLAAMPSQTTAGSPSRSARQLGQSLDSKTASESRNRFSREAIVGEAKRSYRLGTAVKLGKNPVVNRNLGRGVTNFGFAIDEGRGPGVAGDRFEPITDNAFRRVSEHPMSTFSVDVDTASYSKVRDYLMRANQLPRPDAVRIEELVNYFNYDYEPPADSAEHPFDASVSITSCPWSEEHRLARIAIQGKTMEPEERPKCNLVFLLDTSGSMNAANKLPLVIEGMQMLLKQLNGDDRVAITVYAGSAGLVLDSTAAKKQKKIRKALTQLSAGGSTNGGAGIALAYQTARDNFITEGVNRVILCTDGDFNVGTTGTDELVRMVETEAKGGIFLSVLGFGMGNHNDSMLEQVSGRGNGNYAFIDGPKEARKVLVDQTSSTLVTIAKDVKLQIDFNLANVSSYRLIGYENRILAKEDFNDDKKDAGEIGAGHSVTALYQIVPAGVEADAIPPQADEPKYQLPPQPSEAAESGELFTVKLRYKEPDGDTSTLVEFPVFDEGEDFADADKDVRFAAAVASFGMQLRRSPYAGSWTMSDVMNIANRAKGKDRDSLRAEFITLVQKASLLMGEE